MKPPVLCALRVLPALDDLHRLPAEEARRVRRARLQQRHETGRTLLDDLLKTMTGTGDWSIAEEPGGKPALVAAGRSDVPTISISHSGGLLAVAVSRLGPIGVDVERHDARRDVASLARYAFGPQEQAIVAAGGVAAFFRIWTLREAMSKATGEGISMAADGSDRIGPHPPRGAWRTPDGRWLLAHDERIDGYSLAIAILADRSDAPWSEASIGWFLPPEGDGGT